VDELVTYNTKARNRAALVDAARAVMAERGLGAPLDEIARRAGIGNATLYRRFPRRIDLIAAVGSPCSTAFARSSSDETSERITSWPPSSSSTSAIGTVITTSGARAYLHILYEQTCT
jgi:hypothetical protein